MMRSLHKLKLLTPILIYLIRIKIVKAKSHADAKYAATNGKQRPTVYCMDMVVLNVQYMSEQEKMRREYYVPKQIPYMSR